MPGSGGKDSFFVAHMLKYKYNTPLTITWVPHMYTETSQKRKIGQMLGLTIICNTNRKIQRFLTRLAIDNLFNPFQPLCLGRNFSTKIALKLNQINIYGKMLEYGNDSQR